MSHFHKLLLVSDLFLLRRLSIPELINPAIEPSYLHDTLLFQSVNTSIQFHYCNN